MQGWSANPELVRELSEKQPDVIYDELKVPKYTLPDPLVSIDGSRITAPEFWFRKRRNEILELFRTCMYGRTPVERPGSMIFKVFDMDRGALKGEATRKQIEILFTGKSEGPSMDLLIYLPNSYARPTPVFLMLNLEIILFTMTRLYGSRRGRTVLNGGNSFQAIGPVAYGGSLK